METGLHPTEVFASAIHQARHRTLLDLRRRYGGDFRTPKGVTTARRTAARLLSGAATVRSHAGGNETVPTVVVGDVAMVNPSASEVLDTIRAEAPHLEPDDPGGSGGLLDRVLGR